MGWIAIDLFKYVAETETFFLKKGIFLDHLLSDPELSLKDKNTSLVKEDVHVEYIIK